MLRKFTGDAVLNSGSLIALTTYNIAVTISSAISTGQSPVPNFQCKLFAEYDKLTKTSKYRKHVTAEVSKVLPTTI
jgi:hypothetical protein